MPELSRSYGIVVQMYFGDLSPPHFHAIYSGQTAIIESETLAFIDGQLPTRAGGMVVEWAALHQEELREAFRRAEAMESPSKIAPLP
jgi:hypothetical protein